MIDLSQFAPLTILTAGIWIGVFAGGFVGFFTASLFSHKRSRRSYLRGSTDTEKLIRDRLLRDLRGSKP